VGARADAVLLSTTFAVEQVTHLCESERLDLLICDDEFRPQVTTLEARFPGLKGRVVSTAALVNENLGELSRLGRPAPLRGLVRKAGAVVIMTSGTSGPARAVRHTSKAILDRPFTQAIPVPPETAPASAAFATTTCRPSSRSFIIAFGSASKPAPAPSDSPR
jgi:acyl-CoA synthetase (AMP-forming)/AMP-acid ligase II